MILSKVVQILIVLFVFSNELSASKQTLEVSGTMMPFLAETTGPLSSGVTEPKTQEVVAPLSEKISICTYRNGRFIKMMGSCDLCPPMFDEGVLIGCN